MKKIGISVPTIVHNTKIKTKEKNQYKKAVIAMQHNNLVEAKYSMTLQQKRIMIWLISQIQPNDIDFKEHTLSIKELIDICELSGESAYKEIKNITFSLIEKGIRIIDISDPSDDKEIQVSWLSSAKYSNGQVKLSFNPNLSPYLLQLKSKFTAINSTDLMQFKSVHAIRMYELLKQYENIGERILTIEEIKSFCGIENKLKTYPNFEKKLLLISQREINKKSDIKFDYERKKKGRKIVAIKFIISKNKAYHLKNKQDDEIQDIKRRPPMYEILKEYDLSTQMTKKFIKEYAATRIEDAVNAVEIQIKKGGVRNPKAMLIKAIKEGWHPDIFRNRV